MFYLTTAYVVQTETFVVLNYQKKKKLNKIIKINNFK